MPTTRGAVFTARSEHADVDPRVVVVDPVFAATLATTHTRSLAVALGRGDFGPDEFTRHVPNVSEEALAQLDADGLVRPGSAVRPGAKALHEQFAATQVAESQARELEWLERPVDELELSVRTMMGLDKLGVTTVRDLCTRSEAALIRGGLGTKSITELKEILNELGLSLAATDE